MIRPTLRDLHLRFRQEDVRSRAGRWAAWDRRMAGEPGDQPECLKAIRCDARDTGRCRWCGRPCDHPVPRPKPPYSENQGDVLKREAYEYFWGNDETDLPYWYWGAGQAVV